MKLFIDKVRTVFLYGMVLFSSTNLCHGMEKKPILMTKSLTSLRFKAAFTIAKNILTTKKQKNYKEAEEQLATLPLELQAYVNLLVENNLDLYQALWLAIHHYHMYSLDIIKDLIEANKNKLNTPATEEIMALIPHTSGMTLLSYAIITKLPSVITVLLDNGANIEQVANFYSPLFWAILTGSPEIVTLLIQKGALVNKTDNNNVSPLVFAICCNTKYRYIIQSIVPIINPNALKQLLMKLPYVINVDLDESSDKTLNATFIFDRPVGIYKQIKKTNPKNQIFNTLTFKNEQIIHDNLKIIRMLLDNNADITLGKDGYNALIIATLFGSLELVNLLLKRGASIDHQTDDGTTALQNAAEFGHFSTVELLVDHGAAIDHQKKDGTTALLLAANFGHTDIVSFLLEKGASINHQNKNGETALMLAAQFGHFDIVRLLIKNKARIDQQNREGITALMLACESGHKDIVAVLLDSRASINHQDNDGVTALMNAADDGHTAIVELLLRRGATVDVQDNNGTTALLGCAESEYPTIINLLLDSGANINHQDNDGITALMNAAEYGNLSVVQTLLERGADKNIIDHNDNTALSLAQENDHVIVAEILLKD